ncbi:MAG: AI-2E family transporter [Patiriisocius sp.]|uniref:AI-2E family transporter n=1 Tax=Patiriisocius sp. TaxID=2822396 RepID=UPI003EF713A0
MAATSNNFLFKFTALIIAVFFLTWGLIEAKTFLAPLTIAVILSLLLLPVMKILKSWGAGKSLSAIVCTLLLMIISGLFFWLVMAQVNSIVEQWGQIKETMIPKIEQASDFLTENTPVTDEKMDSLEKKLNDIKLLNASVGKNAISFVSNATGFFGQYLLVFIYIFFFLSYKSQFKQFFVSVFGKEEKTRKTLNEITDVAQGYLVGKFKLIAILAVLYAIGLGVSGVNSFVFVALIAALLTLIPYLGNVIGFLLALIFGYLTQGEIGILIGIIITFTITQFVESYILQPYVVGDEVDINPFFVILAVILGNLLWGVIGMVIAIPILGIVHVIVKHVPSLDAYANLIGKGD